jgi:hypothetical protein
MKVGVLDYTANEKKKLHRQVQLVCPSFHFSNNCLQSSSEELGEQKNSNPTNPTPPLLTLLLMDH